MKTSTIIWIIIILAILGGGWYFYGGNSSTDSSSINNKVSDSSQNSVVATTSSNENTTNVVQSTPKTVTVTYGPDGFLPSTVVINKGDTVTFINKGGDEMWIASNPHPTHEGYSGTTKNQHCPDTTGTAFDQCSVGTTYSFAFQKVGNWGYHNHGNAGDKGTVIVK